MDDELARQLQKMRRDRPLQVALWSSSHPVMRLVTWAFVLASASHLWLADAWQAEWLLADLVYLAGLALLCWRGAALGWLLSAVGLAVPLFFHRDQLTQSLILLMVSSTTGVGLMVDAWRATGGTRPPPRLSWDASGPSVGAATGLAVMRGITICTYSLAVLHKLNEQFLDPHFSCAVYGVDELLGYWRLPVDALPARWLALAPFAVLAAEGGIALLHLLRRRRVAWQLAIAFHIPLTLTMAPAFVFVMLVGHAAFATPVDLSRLRATIRRRWPLLGSTAAVLTAGSLLAHGNRPEWTMIPREWLLWALLLTLMSAFPIWRRDTWFPTDRARSQDHETATRERWAGSPPRTNGATQKSPRQQSRPPFALDEEEAPPGSRSPHKLIAAAIVTLFLINGLTPYLGVQYQHAGAMVSNLRIDRGCWNSVVFPESVRLTDDYIRVDEVYFGQPGRVPDYEKIVLDQLWSPPQMRQMRRNWCRPEVRPFYMRGTFRQREFAIEDLCAGEPLPFGEAGIFGREIFGDYLRFQKNLERQCPQSCIH